MSNQQNDTPAEQRQVKRNRTMGLLVLGAVFVPMLAAYLLFKSEFAIPKGTVNKGELLLPPQELSELNVVDAEGQPLNLLDAGLKWRLLIPGGAVCAEQCEKTLYLTRQVHTRLGNKAGRVERYYLNFDGALASQTEALFKGEYPHLKTVHLEKSDFESVISNTSLATVDDIDQRYFLMDQEGFIMMSYLPKNTGNELLADMKRLLKYSYED